jgi:hypothetical protein
LVYRVLWGFDPTFPGAIDEAARDGFNAMLLNVPWAGVQFMDGHCDFSFLDREVAYVVGKNLPVALNIQLGRPPSNASNGNDTVLSPSDYMQDFSGGCICTSWGVQFSFASDNFIQKANEFIQAIVSRYYTLYPQSILYVTVATTLSSEAGYPAAKMADYSPIANAKFGNWLQTKYGSIASLNSAWGTSFSDFNSVPPPPDSAAMWNDIHGLEWYNFRHYMMKQAWASFGATIHGVSPNLRYGIQFAGMSDATAIGRGTVNFPGLIGDADVVWNDDASTENHNYTIDLLRTNSPGKWIAAEFGGLTESPNALAAYPLQATQSFNHGATILSVSNWTQADLANHRPWWSQIASLLSQPVTTGYVSAGMTESVLNLAKTWVNTAPYQAWYQTISNNNGANWVAVIRQDDLYNNSAFNPR